ncbi:MAG: AAA-like domain-containing protein [Cyanobacteria bacterium P01_G01_bin.54]
MPDADAIISFVDRTLYAQTGEHLNTLQRLLLQETWQETRRTYEEIGKAYGYSGSYIQQGIAPKLWRLLSRVFGEKISKKNLRSVLLGQFQQQTQQQAQQQSPQPQTPVVAAPAPPATQPALDYPTDSVPLDSPFYVVRSPLEPQCYQDILQSSALLRIKGPRQIGKTSLMNRILAQAKQAGQQTVVLNFQQAEQSILSDLNRLLRWLAANISRQLKLPAVLDEFWDQDTGSKMSCTLYMEGYLLAETQTPWVLALEEISELFDYPEVARDFLAMLRTWHEYTKVEPEWQTMRLVLVQSTESYVQLNINQSPFNVGLELALQPFTAEQVQDLAQRHQLALTPAQLAEVMQGVAGHPHLVRLLFYHLAQGTGSWSELMAGAATDTGIYHDHLHRHLGQLEKFPALRGAFAQVLQADQPIELPQVEAFRLQSMGLVQLLNNQVTVSCELYRQYFAGRLEC